MPVELKGAPYLLNGLDYDFQMVTLFCRKTRDRAFRYGFEQACAIFGGHLFVATFVSA